MPITPTMLDDLDLSVPAAARRSAGPKFFSSRLTGEGKKIGLLNEFLLPINTCTNLSYASLTDIEMKQSSTQHDSTDTSIPLAPLTRRALLANNQSFRMSVPHVDDRFAVDITGAIGAGPDWEVSFDMTPQALTLYEDKSGDKPKRDLVIQYRMELFIVDKAMSEPPQYALLSSYLTAGSAHAFLRWDTSPMDNARSFIDETLDAMNLAASNLDDLEDWLRGYSVYEHIAGLAQVWDSDAIAEQVCTYIADMPLAPTSEELNALALQLRYLENYNVPLDAYRAIHVAIETTFPDTVATDLSKQNLNLLMNHTLDRLSQMKSQLVTPAQPTTPAVVDPRLSQQQREALTTHEPLVMTQAGAGTGKSTVILERIAYLQSCHVDAGDITVLSFTNAAADNITKKNPAVGSMTIARMIIDIYELNHPGHKISAIDTIINSIDIFYPNNQFAAQFRSRLVDVDAKKTGAFTGLNTFVENNFDQVIALLDQIQQTSLELQIIICYQRIDTMAEPAHVQSKFLIIDEVQDNSVFEFIYVLKYISKHSQSLFIVGDASQTLYEFRSANPRALNTLEGSGVFATFKLTTNYRSNQEILDFANVVLGGLETNQFANIQLQANSLVVPTADSFQEKVVLDYRQVGQTTKFISEELCPIVQNTIAPQYVDACLNRNEQVAFLAYSRREVALVQAALEYTYPQRTVSTLVSDRVHATDIFSKYIKCFWNDVLQAPPHNASFVVYEGIKNNLGKLTRNASSPNVEKAIMRSVAEWWVDNSATINGWVQSCSQGALSHAVFFEWLRDNLLDFEISRNQKKLNVNRQRNEDRKRKNLEVKSDLVVSTIHGAKGLEFDNVVVLYKEDTAMSQETRRLFYVAFTRAIRSEYVLSYGTVKHPPIQSSFDRIVAALTTRDTRNAQRSSGVDPALLDTGVDDDADGNQDTGGNPAGVSAGNAGDTV